MVGGKGVGSKVAAKPWIHAVFLGRRAVLLAGGRHGGWQLAAGGVACIPRGVAFPQQGALGALLATISPWPGSS